MISFIAFLLGNPFCQSKFSLNIITLDLPYIRKSKESSNNTWWSPDFLFPEKGGISWLTLSLQFYFIFIIDFILLFPVLLRY